MFRGNIKIILPFVLGISLLAYLGTKLRSNQVTFEPATAHADEKHETAEHKEGEKEDHEETDSDDEHGGGHGDEEEEDGDFGEGKAIVAVRNDGRQFQLSEESSKFLGVATAPLRVVSPGVVSIKRDELVEYMSDVGIFVSNENWIELKKAEIIGERSDELTIKVPGLKPGDQLVISPLKTLRAAQLQASGEGGKGHAH